MLTIHVNFWAVIVCAIVSQVIGFLWYGPLFGKPWRKSMGMNPEPSANEKKEMQSKAMPGYAAMFVGSLVMAYALSKVLGHFGATGTSEAMKVAAEIWFGFVATVFLGGKFFERKSWTHYFITVGYQLVNMLVYSIILVSWK